MPEKSVHGEISNPNPNSNRKKTKEIGRNQFEFCKVCRLNHDNGQRHKYFPSHKKSLSACLSRFKSKLSDVRFFLANPAVLRPEHSSRNRFWCTFCDIDIEELGSSFACNNAIIHLSSVDHLNNLKHFMWKYGSGVDHLDSFRFLDEDVKKWQNKCAKLKREASICAERCHGPLTGLSNDIHLETYSGKVDTFENNYDVYPSKLCSFNGVAPSQHSTNEYQIPQHGIARDANAGGFSSKLATSDPSLYTANGPNGVEGNVHSGAPPPWLNDSERALVDYNVKSLSVNGNPPSNKPEKSQKLNPKRVGAAWAEKRKLEMELEKRGEIAKPECNPNWLPNFGRVWQSGSRKESRKEFEVEKQIPLNEEEQSETSIQILPYMSKRN